MSKLYLEVSRQNNFLLKEVTYTSWCKKKYLGYQGGQGDAICLVVHIFTCLHIGFTCTFNITIFCSASYSKRKYGRRII